MIFYILFRSNLQLFDSWEVLFDDISLHTIIGEGAFEKVYSGRLLKQTMDIGRGRKSSQSKTDKKQQQMKMGLTVAVKVLQTMICLCQRFMRVSMGLTVNRQMAKKLTVNRQKRNILTVNRQMSAPKLAVKFLFLIFNNFFHFFKLFLTFFNFF